MEIPEYTGEDIVTLTDLEDFRKNSSQYVGSGGLDTDVQLFLEICLNATDEAIDPNRTYVIKIIFFTNEKGTKYQVALQDHGRGIPLDKIKDIYTKRATSGKYSSKAYNGLSSGCWGVGSKLTSALSDHFISISKRSDGFGGVKIVRGVTQTCESYKPLDNDSTTNGTTVIYETDTTIVRESSLYMNDPRGFAATLKKLEFMSVSRPNIKFIVYRKNELLPESWFNQSFEKQWKYINNFDGEVVYRSPDNISMFDYAKQESNIESPTVWTCTFHKDIDFSNINDTVGYDIKLGLTAHPEKENGILGTVNGNIICVPTASHISVLQSVIKSRLVQYLDEDNSELKSFFEQQYNIPFHGYVIALCKNAKFISQVKSSFMSIDFSRLYDASLHKQLDTIDDSVFEALFELIQDDIIKKFSQSMNKALNTGKSLKNVGCELIRYSSYYACETRDKSIATLSIVEGMSSGSAIIQCRDASYQAVYELRGKCINTFVATPDSWRKDEVFKDLVRLIGVHFNDTNLDNMNFREICLMADADPDGLAIIDLLIGMLYKINPLIIEHGRVKVAMPPLYVMEIGNRIKYLRDQKALDDFRAEIYRSRLDLEVSVNAGPILKVSGNAYRDLVYLIKDITDRIEDTSRKLAIEPYVVEIMCHCVDYIKHTDSQFIIDTETIKKMLKLDYCVFTKDNNVLTMISGNVEQSVPMDRLIDEINYNLLPMLESVKWRKFDLFITTKVTDTYKHTPAMFWQIRENFNRIDKGFPVRRLKGLGEYTAEELKYTCMDPNTRTVLTIEGVGDVNILHDMLGEDTAARKKLVMSDMDLTWTRGKL